MAEKKSLIASHVHSTDGHIQFWAWDLYNLPLQCFSGWMAHSRVSFSHRLPPQGQQRKLKSNVILLTHEIDNLSFTIKAGSVAVLVQCTLLETQYSAEGAIIISLTTVDSALERLMLAHKGTSCTCQRENLWRAAHSFLLEALLISALMVF